MKKGLKRVLSSMLAATMVVGAVSIGNIDFAPINKVVGTVDAYAASTITISECRGWLETAWVEWKPTSTSGVSYYAVSYSKDGTSFTTIDNELIRYYGDGHWRADLVGLAAGNYTVKVDAFNSSKVSISNETANVTVTGHDRTGFNFSPASTLYDSSDSLQSGAYKGDGTLKSNADVIYITSASDIDSVTYDGFTGLSNILLNRDKGSGRPLAVRMIGKLDYSGSQLNSSGYIQVKPSKSYTDIATTIEGIGEDTALNFGFLLRNAGNVEIRNIAVHDFADDGISLDTDNCNVWLHNNEFFYGKQGSGDKAKGDGSSDVKNDSKYITLSYNHYWDAGKCSLCGMKSETGDNYITYHHNWFDHSDSRHPRIRTMFVHVYNNYYDGNAKYGVGTSADSNAFVEGNYFRNCKHPTLQGSVGYDSDGKGGSNTFDDSSPIGAVKLYNNYMDGSNLQFTPDSDGDTAGNGDGCVATSRNQVITYTTAANATYRNIDVTNDYIQSLTPEEPADAKTTVETYAGKTGGGDFAAATGFAFDDSVDDTADTINSTLRTAITNYANNSLSSEYVINSVGGSVDGTEVPTEATTSPSGEVPTEATTASPSGDITTETTTAAEIVAGDYDHDFTANGKTSSYYTITGNLSTDKPTPTGYTNMTQCLKMESSTSIKFSSEKGKITLITTAEATSPGIKIDDVSYDVAEDGSTTIPLEAGAHTITKDSSSTYIYYMSFVADSGSGETPTVVKGDADDSGTTDAADVTMIMEYVVGIINSVTNSEAADVNADSKVSSADAYLIQKYLNNGTW